MIGPIYMLGLRAFFGVALALACAYVAFRCGAYLLRARRDPQWLDNLGNQAAVAIFIFMCGETLGRGWGAVLLALYRHNIDVALWENQIPISFVGMVIAYVGCVFKMRIFASSAHPRQWVPATAVIVLVAAAVALVG